MLDLHMMYMYYVMTSYFNACDVTVANSYHKIFLQLFDLHLCPPTLKKVPSPLSTTLSMSINSVEKSIAIAGKSFSNSHNGHS